MGLTRSVTVESNGLTASFEAGFSNATARVIAAQEAFPEICQNELDRAAHDAADILYDVWAGMSPVDTGEYVRSLHKDVTEWGSDRVDIEVWNDAEHAEHIEYGTANAGRGYIYPYERKFMTFKKPNGGPKDWIRAHRVRGQRAQRIASRASAAAKPLMMAQFRLATNRAHNRLKGIL